MLTRTLIYKTLVQGCEMDQEANKWYSMHVHICCTGLNMRLKFLMKETKSLDYTYTMATAQEMIRNKMKEQLLAVGGKYVKSSVYFNANSLQKICEKGS